MEVRAGVGFAPIVFLPIQSRNRPQRLHFLCG